MEAAIRQQLGQKIQAQLPHQGTQQPRNSVPGDQLPRLHFFFHSMTSQ